MRLFSRVRDWFGEPDPVTDGGITRESEDADEGDTDRSRPEPTDGDDEDELNVDDDLLLDSIGSPVFMLDTTGEIVAWNDGLAEMTGVSGDDAIGQMDAGDLVYANGESEKTLAQKVLSAPETAHEQYDVNLRDPELLVYATERQVVGPTGKTHYCEVTARPLFEGGEFVAVVQTLIDNTTEVRRRESVEGLVDEIQDTLRELMNGNLGARAEFHDEYDCLDDELMLVIEELNRTGEAFEETAAGMDEQAERLRTYVEQASDAAQSIAENVGDQNELLEEGVSEMQTFSASMEEVAATAEQVDQAAAQARDAANEGLDASEDAREATDDVTEIGQELVDSVTELGERMDEIEEVVEVISDVAEQTNLLALNANIEAARAGQEGDGFAVVAEEVKSLADETRSHTEEITESIEELQSQTDETVVAAEQSHEQIDHAAEQIDDVLIAFEEIADAIDEAADGIGEVSRATDDQASTIEELTATIEDVRERSDETEDAARDIVEATDEQDDAIDELSDRVAELRGNHAVVSSDGGTFVVTDASDVVDDDTDE
jgi:methyl-accepting chemotaxis protein